MMISRKKIKICHLTSVHSFTDTRIFVKECRSLASSGYETHLIAPDAPDEVKEGVYLHGVQKISKNRLLRMTQTVWDVYQKALSIDADIYHFHDPELMTIGMLLKSRGKKVIYDVHEDLPRQMLTKNYIPSVYRQVTSQIVEMIENLTVRQFDGIISATPFIRDRFLKLGYHVIDINNYPILKELHIPDIDWTHKEQVVCYIGGITKVRGIFQMVEAIEQINSNLLLAGRFGYSKERQEAIAMPGWNHVKELGQLNRPEIAQLLSRVRAGLVVLHPTINYLDALPVKMFEYMSAGIPVIASNFPLWKEIIEGNQCGICVDPMNPQAIAEAIQWVLDHPVEAQCMGQNGRLAVESQYNWENEAQKLYRLYQQIIEG